jgi:hypothetical protein
LSLFEIDGKSSGATSGYYLGAVIQNDYTVAICPPVTRGLNRNFNRRLKHVFKSAALQGAGKEPFKSYYQARVAAGMRPEMARLTLARKIANITLTLWKNGGQFNEHKLSDQHDRANSARG